MDCLKVQCNTMQWQSSKSQGLAGPILSFLKLSPDLQHSELSLYCFSTIAHPLYDAVLDLWTGSILKRIPYKKKGGNSLFNTKLRGPNNTVKISREKQNQKDDEEE